MLELFDPLLIPLFMILLLLAAAAPLIVVYLFLRLTTEAFIHVGFSHWHAILMVFGSVMGSVVNIPLNPIPVTAYPLIFLEIVDVLSALMTFTFPTTFHPVTLTVNLGGCIIPMIVSVAILVRCHVSARRAALGILIVALVTYHMAVPVADEGILLPIYVPPTLAAVCGLTLARRFQTAPALAYISGTMGTLLGADILRLLTPGTLPILAPPEENAAPLVLSIGGAGVIDGIFLTGVFAVLMAVLMVHLFHRSGDTGSCSCIDP
ncbi:MAG: DUF1614 domain-containing protein [Euryarchaeota archaeon]|nr:DUF1614 domain-containing protein [Euryarchaeota archaeon]